MLDSISKFTPKNGEEIPIQNNPFRPPSGKLVFRVSGSLHGRQVRKNDKTREEAVQERDDLDIQQRNGPGVISQEEAERFWAIEPKKAS